MADDTGLKDAIVPHTIPTDTVDLAHFAAAWQDTAAANGAIYRAFEAGTNAIPELRRHRDFVEANDHGYGDRAFHFLWKLLIDEMPSRFKFLEVGVYKGQVVSLIRLLSDLAAKSPQVVGVTPLTPAGDRFSVHPECDYLEAIATIHRELGIATDALTLIRGFSQETETLRRAAENGPYDIVYIDGCHELEVVVSDLTFYPQMLRPGGYLVVDDCSTMLDLPAGLFPGLYDVSLAVQEILDPDPAFEHLLACGHNRVWQRRSPGT